MDINECLDLPDGRQLELRVSGPEDGTTLVFHHGTPGSGLPVRAIARAAHDRGLRLLAVTRPGYGRSSPHPDRRVINVVDDTSAALDFVGADRCLVAGWSGGGPHALACAARLPGARAVLVIAGVGPYNLDTLDWMAGMGEDNLVEFKAALESEEALRTLLTALRADLQHVTPDMLIGSMEGILPPVDQEVLTDEFGEDMAALFQDGLLEGIEGWVEDDVAFLSPWGFGLSEVTIPTLVWQGSADLMVPFAHGQWLSEHLPNATPHLEEGEGHLSITLGAIERMLDELVQVAAD